MMWTEGHEEGRAGGDSGMKCNGMTVGEARGKVGRGRGGLWNTIALWNNEEEGGGEWIDTVRDDGNRGGGGGGETVERSDTVGK